ncbi:MAG TPA: hypothetical protein ENK11_09745, partial [Phycisphaerales bacterium]|nr:hypothetical protein [Phycisphaerales bacterium]
MTTPLIGHVLGDGGLVAGVLGPSYEARPEQLRMAEAVARTLEARTHLVVEAGTGVGKSFAYLVPAIGRALAGEVVVVATNTIALQEQLVHKDVPLLAGTLEEGHGAAGPRDHEEEGPPGTSAKGTSALRAEIHGSENRGTRAEIHGSENRGTRAEIHGSENHRSPEDHGSENRATRENRGTRAETWAGELRAVLAKGRGNYLSIRRLKLTSERQDRLLPDAASRRSLHVIEDWALDTADGSLATLPALERPGVWDKVQSDSGNCMGRKCPFNDRCFYQNARRELERANLIITNHALFFADLAMRARSGGDIGVLPDYDHVILDEAHTVEDSASDHFGLSLTEGQVSFLLGTLYHPRTGKGYLANLELAAGDLEPIERAVRLIHEAEAASRAFFDSLVELERSGKAPGGRIREPGIVENPLTPAMNNLATQLRRLKDLMPEGGPGEADRFELTSYRQRAAEIADAAEQLIEQQIEGCCYWVDTGSSAPGTSALRAESLKHGSENRGTPENRDARGRRRVTLACSPIEVAPLLKEHLFDQSFSVVMTSATLATRNIDPDEPAERAEAAFA